VTPRERNLADIGELAEKHGYTVEDILGRSRHKKLVAVRLWCVLMLRHKGYSTTEIGRIMNRDHSTIVHALNKEVK
jgi:chromosomal replication initiation ATPase DnaA